MDTATRGYLGTEEDVVLARVGAFVLDHVLTVLLGAVLLLVLVPETAGVGYVLLVTSYLLTARESRRSRRA